MGEILMQIQAQMLAGNTAAENDLWDTCGELIRKLVYHELIDRDLLNKVELDDPVDRVFLYLIRKLKDGGLAELMNESDFLKVLRRQAFQHVSRVAKKYRTDHSYKQPQSMSPDLVDPVDPIANLPDRHTKQLELETRDCLMHFKDQISIELQRVVEYVEIGLSLTEIAQKLGVSKSTITYRMTKIRVLWLKSGILS